MQQYKAIIVEKKHLTLHTLELSVSLEGPTDIEFLAGQYMEFAIGNVWKPFTMASKPGKQQVLTFCIGLYDEGLASNYFRAVKAGDYVTLRGPGGFFTVTDLTKNYFFVATGVGIAPFVSIVPDMLSKGYQGNLHLLFGVRHEEDVFYFDKFTHLKGSYENFTFTPTLSRPKSHWPGETGRVTTYVEVAYEYYKDYDFYICGGPEMVKDTQDILVKKGHDPHRVKVEIFV